jgi:Zn finger protein HypA/HybF involved in hydrogenase expression
MNKIVVNKMTVVRRTIKMKYPKYILLCWNCRKWLPPSGSRKRCPYCLKLNLA